MENLTKLTKEELEQLCPKCLKARASTRRSRLCGTCHKKVKLEKTLEKTGTISPDLLARAALAKTVEDWQKIARELAPTMTAIMNGEIKATAAQASLIKDILNRAFGKPGFTQSSQQVAAGVIILPALSTGKNMHICPKCGYNAPEHSLVSEQGTADSFPSIDR